MSICGCAQCVTDLLTLGLRRPVTFDEIAVAHKDLAKVWHPDRFEKDPRLRGKAEEELKNIQQAFTRLKSHREYATSGESTTTSTQLTADDALDVFRNVLDGKRIFHVSQLDAVALQLVCQRFGKEPSEIRVVVDSSLTRGFGSGVLFTATQIVNRQMLGNFEFSYPELRNWVFTVHARNVDLLDRFLTKASGGSRYLEITATRNGNKEFLSFSNVFDDQTIALHKILLWLKQRFS